MWHKLFEESIDRVNSLVWKGVLSFLLRFSHINIDLRGRRRVSERGLNASQGSTIVFSYEINQEGDEEAYSRAASRSLATLATTLVAASCW
jgi:hypothetical protein